MRLQSGQVGVDASTILKPSCCDRCLSRSCAYEQYKELVTVDVVDDIKDLSATSLASGPPLAKIVVFTGLPARTVAGSRYGTRVVDGSSWWNDPGMDGARSDPLRDLETLLVRSSAASRYSNAVKISTDANAASCDAASILDSCCCIGSEEVGPYRNVVSSTLWSLITSDCKETCDNASEGQLMSSGEHQRKANHHQQQT